MYQNAHLPKDYPTFCADDELADFLICRTLVMVWKGDLRAGWHSALQCRHYIVCRPWKANWVYNEP